MAAGLEDWFKMIQQQYYHYRLSGIYSASIAPGSISVFFLRGLVRD